MRWTRVASLMLAWALGALLDGCSESQLGVGLDASGDQAEAEPSNAMRGDAGCKDEDCGDSQPPTDNTKPSDAKPKASDASIDAGDASAQGDRDAGATPTAHDAGDETGDSQMDAGMDAGIDAAPRDAGDSVDDAHVPMDASTPTDMDANVDVDPDDAGTDAGGPPDPCAPPPLEADEQCWDLSTHNPGDLDSAFSIYPGESYHNFYFDVPWPSDHVATRFLGVPDSNGLGLVLDASLFGFPQSTRQHGDIDQNVVGNAFGASVTWINRWSAGSCATLLPAEVGQSLTHQGKLMLQVHATNATGVMQLDRTTMRVCTRPSTSLAHTADLAVLGTELIGQGPLGLLEGPGSATGTCLNDSGYAITLVGWQPHMHRIGVRTTVERKASDGSKTLLYDAPFSFPGGGVHWETPAVTLPHNESIVTTCYYDNDTGRRVAFGQGTKSEQCYLYTYAYPAGLLANGVATLSGVINACW